MRKKKLSILIIGALLIFSISSFAETKKLERIGFYTLCKCKGEIPTAEVMKSIVERYAGDIKYGFDMVGYGDMYLTFIDQIKEAQLIEKELPVGERMMWMLYRSRGRVKVVEDLEWAGTEPLGVYSFFVEKNDRVYEFVMPKPCGNVALRKIGTGKEFIKELRELGKIEEFKEEYEEFIEKYIVPDAICDISVTPQKANVGDPISIDMSGSQNAKSMQVEIYDSVGTKVAVQMLTPEAPKWQTTFDKPGEYTFKPMAFNAEGKPSENPCEAQIYVNFPPICKLAIDCLPCKHLVGMPIIINASDSTDPDGEVVRVDIEIIDEAGNVVDKMTITEKPFEWERAFTEPGSYAITARVTDDFGAVSEPCALGPPVEPGVEVPLEEFRIDVVHKKLFLLVDVAPMAVKVPRYTSPATFVDCWGFYFALRAGLLYKIVPNLLEFIIKGGGAYNFTSEDPDGDEWRPVLMASVLLNFRQGPFFIGAGVGLTTEVKANQVNDADIIANLGFDAFEILKATTSIFGELRVPIGERHCFFRSYKILAGLRLHF